MPKTYRVVKITNNLKEYPEAAADTAEYPELVEHVSDMFDLFVVDEDRKFWPSNEFFYMLDVAQFSALTESEVKTIEQSEQRAEKKKARDHYYGGMAASMYPKEADRIWSDLGHDVPTEEGNIPNGIKVKTFENSEDSLDDWTEEAMARRFWEQTGTVVSSKNSGHGMIYVVLYDICQGQVWTGSFEDFELRVLAG